MGNKGLIIAVILVIAVIIIAASTFFGFNSAEQYQGLIQRIENQTDDLKADNPLTDSLSTIDIK